MLLNIDTLSEISKNFTREIISAKSEKKSSVSFIKNYLPTVPLIKEKEVFQVLMIGGSHIESVLVSIENDFVKILKNHEDDVPAIDNREILCQVFAKNLYPEINTVAVNFAYPITPFLRNENKLDGSLYSATKQHKFIDCIGSNVGEMFENYISKTYNRKIDVSLCNDTVALGLASFGFDNQYKKTQIITGVVGTGYNFGFFENDNLFINLESGNFDKFSPSSSVLEIDKNSNNPKKQLLEKEVGGAYLAWQFNLLAKKENLNIEISDTRELSQVALKKGKAGEIARNIFEKAASLVAMQIKAIYDYKKNTEDYKILILLEGSVYWKGYKFKEYVDYYLAKMGLTENYYEITAIERIGIIGAARLVV